ncbi:hypothetical protein BIV57_00120 [Mangrovactinospora gilvigrisea]|uniref:Uncharacterized protein n=1 Tax=Mangrovactinospora gilvigrisea TaxID=1428644 RepID=A0A1J7CCN2_9ACTN|nr:hypothetical protein [Mangrovactinospora gilvigrisea]OIV39296.1 hypothetical protein BIV57_00120 [Mangrovactinospora gilvigrisea]
MTETLPPGHIPMGDDDEIDARREAADADVRLTRSARRSPAFPDARRITVASRRRRRPVVAIAVGLLLTATACANHGVDATLAVPGLVGTWTDSDGGRIVFRKDRTFTAGNLKLAQRSPGMETCTNQEQDGQWQFFLESADGEYAYGDPSAAEGISVGITFGDARSVGACSINLDVRKRDGRTELCSSAFGDTCSLNQYFNKSGP